MVLNILKSAKMNFGPAEYYVGRWLVDGQSYFPIDVEQGYNYLRGAILRGYIPAICYINKLLKRKKDEFSSYENMKKLFDIAVEGYSEQDDPEAMVMAIANAY